jgi:hypothetical protein
MPGGVGGGAWPLLWRAPGFRLRTQLLVAVGRCPVNGVSREGDGDRRVAVARWTAVAEADAGVARSRPPIWSAWAGGGEGAGG